MLARVRRGQFQILREERQDAGLKSFLHAVRVIAFVGCELVRNSNLGERCVHFPVRSRETILQFSDGSVDTVGITFVVTAERAPTTADRI